MGRNIILACGHPEGLATLARDELTAWCPVCEIRVEVSKTGEPTALNPEFLPGSAA